MRVGHGDITDRGLTVHGTGETGGTGAGHRRSMTRGTGAAGMIHGTGDLIITTGAGTDTRSITITDRYMSRTTITITVRAPRL